MSGIYDINKSYQENADSGPRKVVAVPQRKWPKRDSWCDFLGEKIASPIGVAAGPLLNAKWVEYAGELGYDLPTYKTIRSRAHPSHPLPNILPVEVSHPLMAGGNSESVREYEGPFDLQNSRIGITNSFGNPSQGPEFLQRDIEFAIAALAPGQALIVSVFGSESADRPLFDDFAEAAYLAADAGARLIEVNTSCPNVTERGGSLYQSPDMVHSLVLRIRQRVKEQPLILKVGAFTSLEQMISVFIAAERAGASAICGINTIPMNVVGKNGNAALGPDRLKCGICGNPIREAALEFVRWGREIIEREKLNLKLMATGGATTAEHLELFLRSGADIALTATGMMWHPLMAAEFHKNRERCASLPKMR